MKYKCEICQWIYDEEVEGTPFEELPDDYLCPVCNAPKDMFTLIEE